MKTFVLMMVSLLFAVSLEAQNKSFYDFTVKTIDGKDFPLSSLKGKKVLVVNVASKCGLTPQYAQLEKLYEKYKDKDFVIIGFPANNFMGQEPGSNEEIAQFCSLNYDVTFPMMAKISVKGKEIALKREVREELGITDFIPELLTNYVFESEREKELVFVHKTVYDGEIHPSEELDGGRFWTIEEIKENLGKGIFTPNFESELQKVSLIPSLSK